MQQIVELIYSLKDKGLKLEVDETGERLKVKGNTKLLTDADKKAIGNSKQDIIQFLQANKNGKVVHETIDRIPEAPDYALSSAQTRLWVLSQFKATSVAYNMPALFYIEGKLDKGFFQQAFEKVIERHEILRTYFRINEAGEVRQHIRTVEELDFKMGYHDWQSLSVSQEHLDAEFRDLAVEPFDLANGPLLRVSLYKIGEARYTLFFNMHHTIGDGGSFEVFLREIMACYEALTEGKEISLPSLPLQYKDYAAWQKKQLEGSKLEEHRGFWLDQFSGEIPVLELPTKQARPAVMTYNGAAVSGRFDKDITSGLNQLTRSEGGTLFMGLLAGMKALFYRYTGQEDIVIGSPTAGRDHVDLQGQIGPYINILALRTQFSGEESFLKLFREVKSRTLNAYKHQVYPFDELVTHLDLSRDASRAALFDIMLILHNQSERSSRFEQAGMSLQPADLVQTTSKFDMSFNFTEVDGELAYTVEYNADLYSHRQMDRMMGHLETLLASVVENSHQPLRDIVYLEPVEEQRLLVDFNDTKTDYPEDKTIIDLFEAQVAESPDAVAVVFGSTELSYAQLNERANQRAKELLEAGTKRGDLIGLYMERSEHMLAAMLGILKSGAAYVPLDPAYPTERIAYVIEDAEINTILTDRRLSHKLSDFKGQILVVDNALVCESESTDTGLNSSDLAYVIYTSGSTGKPKGVLVEHGNVVNFFTGMNQEIGKSASDNTLLAVTTMSFDISVLELLWTLSNGFKVVIQPTRQLKTGTESEMEISTKKMDFSLFYFASEVDQHDKYRLLIEGAKFGDKNGFSAIWTPERHFHEFGGIYPNPAVAGAAIATITENIHIRSGSCVLPLHNPIRVAEEWSVVDNLSNGRVGLSFASGWVLNDFLAFAPETFETRHKALYEGIEKVKDLWRGGSIELENPTGPNASVEIHPKPLQKELPIWVTAAGNPETFRSAGKMGANLLTHLLGQTIEELETKIEVYREAWKAAGHEGEGHVTLMIHTFIGEDMASVKETVRAPFSQYLRNATGLIKTLARSVGQDPDAEDFSEEDLSAMIDYAFNRYFDTAALFGTPDSCLSMVNRLSHIGVDEVGCLVDFGIDPETTISGFERLNVLKERYAEQQLLVEEKRTMAELIRDHEVSHLQCTPSALKILLMEADVKESLSSLRELMIGGEALPADLLAQARKVTSANIHNMYGPTETTIWSTMKSFSEEDTAVSIGKPIANTQICLLDQNLKVVPEGVQGAIYIGGAGVTRGYWKRPDLTSERFIDNPYRPGERMYHTGDVGRWLPDGTIEFLGRSDNQVKIRGHRIELGEIETTLRSDPAIKDVVVQAVRNKHDDWELAAYIVCQDEMSVSEIKSDLGDRLPAYMIPSYFLSLEALPLTPNGKVDRKNLPPLEGAATAIETEYVAPRNEIEQKLVAMWSEVLERDEHLIGIRDNFFESGGHSLNAVRLMGLIKQQLDVKIDLQMLFYNPTIEGLHDEIEIIYWSGRELAVAASDQKTTRIRI